jgi:7-cyano-7-deazaguanine synthase
VKKMLRIVLLLSGGVESLVIAAKARADLPRVSLHAIHIDYGQRARERERRAVRTMSRLYGFQLEEAKVELPFLESHALIDPETAIMATTGNGVPTRGHIVPFRNLAFLGLATMFAGTLCADEIWTGFDFTNRPDSANDKRPEFVGHLNRAIGVSGEEGQAITVVTPLQGYTKSDTIKLGETLQVPWEISWSCYNDFMRPCGACGSCLSRRQGFINAGVDEKVDYCTAEFVREQLLE